MISVAFASTDSAAICETAHPMTQRQSSPPLPSALNQCNADLVRMTKHSSDDLPLVSLLLQSGPNGSLADIHSLQSSTTAGCVRQSLASTAAPVEQREVVKQSWTSPSGSVSTVEMPILALDPKEFTRITAARHKAKMQAFREAEQQQQTQQTAATTLPYTATAPAGQEKSGATATAVTANPQPPGQLKPLRQAATFSLPRSAFDSDAEFVEDALRRFCISDADVVDWERRTWRPAAV